MKRSGQERDEVGDNLGRWLDGSHLANSRADVHRHATGLVTAVDVHLVSAGLRRGDESCPDAHPIGTRFQQFQDTLCGRTWPPASMPCAKR